VHAPLPGWCDSLNDSPDPVFRDRTLGDGVSIDPTGNDVVAPFDGTVTALLASKHAIGLRADNGAEVLIHVGIDTVTLGGAGFDAFVAVGDRVTRGQKLLRFDMDAVARSVPSLRTPVLLLDSDVFELRRDSAAGFVARGEPIFEIRRKAVAQPVPDATASAAHAAPARDVVVGLAHGIHARPAALIAAALKPFAARVECRVAGGGAADARSVVALMALGVRHGQRVTLAASGADADAALAAAVPFLEPIEGASGRPESVAAATGSQAAVARYAPPAPGSVIRARPAGAGVALGTVVQLGEGQVPPAVAAATPAEERARLAGAVAAVRGFLERLAAERDGVGREIAGAHLALLDDPEIAAAARARIDAGGSAAAAWHAALGEFAEALQRLDDPRLRERADDLRDLDRRMQRVLAGAAPDAGVTLPAESVIVAANLLPSELLELEPERIAGICTAAGGTTSHVAILAAALGIPTLVAAGEAVLGIPAGTAVGVDADFGELIVQPDAKLAAALQTRARDDEHRRARELAAAAGPCITTDGVSIHVHANLGSQRDAQQALECGADGCGLLRTEFLFMDRSEPPTVDEQRHAYQEISDALGARPLIVRTLDAGGDKPVAYLAQRREDNPALGVRGVRLSLRERSLFEAQLEALCRVERAGPLRIMIPMVASLAEVDEVRRILEEVRSSHGLASETQLGIMIETPAAALLADRFAAVVDFFSIGSNDLAQYTLAIDRGEPTLAAALDVLHPAVLRLVAQTAAAATAAGKPVGVCGAAAGDTMAAPLFVGLGIRELSMLPRLIPRQKALLRGLRVDACARLAKDALAMHSAEDVRAMMRAFLARLQARD
jgi:multiphosphoryl transfer protein